SPAFGYRISHEHHPCFLRCRRAQFLVGVTIFCEVRPVVQNSVQLRFLIGRQAIHRRWCFRCFLILPGRRGSRLRESRRTTGENRSGQAATTDRVRKTVSRVHSSLPLLLRLLGARSLRREGTACSRRPRSRPGFPVAVFCSALRQVESSPLMEPSVAILCRLSSS